jgi:hypothetical protein
MADMNDSEATEPRPSRLRKGTVLASLFGFVVFFLVSGAFVRSGERAARQPIQFNHRIHVVDNDMSCSECHVYYEKQTFSGLPTRETCAFCHDEPIGQSPKEQRLVEMLQSGAPLEWSRLFKQPRHVFYSHRRHVVVAGLECETCHGDIAETESPPRSVRNLVMDDCLSCHEQEHAQTDCTTCHR